MDPRISGCCGISSEHVADEVPSFDTRLIGFHGLTDVDLESSSLTDGQLAQLSILSGMKVLRISFNPTVTGESLSALSTTPLETLYMSACGIKDKFVVQLEEIPTLRTLWMGLNRHVTGEHFDRLPQLVEFRASGCAIEDAGVAKLGHIRSLKRLYLDSNKKIRGKTFSKLSPTLQELFLRNCNLSKKCLLAMRHLTNLTSLRCASEKGLGKQIDVPAVLKTLQEDEDFLESFKALKL